jgi:hypothetical protein
MSTLADPVATVCPYCQLGVLVGEPIYVCREPACRAVMHVRCAPRPPRCPGELGLVPGLADERDSDACEQCHGEQRIVVCLDDLCRGAGVCMHSDGERPCPACILASGLSRS